MSGGENKGKASQISASQFCLAAMRQIERVIDYSEQAKGRKNIHVNW